MKFLLSFLIIISLLLSCGSEVQEPIPEEKVLCGSDYCEEYEFCDFVEVKCKTKEGRCTKTEDCPELSFCDETYCII